jgi:hypothetical protein
VRKNQVSGTDAAEFPEPTLAEARPQARAQHTVRSIQRLPSLPLHDAAFISSEYMAWLPRFFRTVVRVTREPTTGRVVFSLAFFSPPLLVLEYVPSPTDLDRQKFHIVAGILSKTTSTGWLEFRQVAKARFTLASIHEFVPALPWLVYIATQAPVHAFVMARFGRHLEHLRAIQGGRDAATPQER